jgi:hypothetical protein
MNGHWSVKAATFPTVRRIVRSQLWVEGLPLLQMTLRKLHKLTFRSLQPWLRLTASCNPHQINSTGLLCGLHAPATGTSAVAAHYLPLGIPRPVVRWCGYDRCLLARCKLCGGSGRSFLALRAVSRFQEQLIVFVARSVHPGEAARREAERCGKPHLFVSPRCRELPLYSPLRIPRQSRPGDWSRSWSRSWKKVAFFCAGEEHPHDLL